MAYDGAKLALQRCATLHVAFVFKIVRALVKKAAWQLSYQIIIRFVTKTRIGKLRNKRIIMWVAKARCGMHDPSYNPNGVELRHLQFAPSTIKEIS
jgi:hypothetical protein